MKAGLDGIKKKLEPGDPVDQDVYKLSKAKRKELGIQRTSNNTQRRTRRNGKRRTHQRNPWQPRIRRVHRTENKRLEPILPIRIPMGNNEVP
jgi:predicted RNA-binding protein with RPS1 domain